MYKAGYRRHKSHIIRFLLGIIVMVTVVAAIAWFFRGTNSVVNPAPVTRTVSSNEGATKSFDEGIFTFSLPADWIVESHDTQQYTLRSTKKYYDNRTLNIYLDTIPPNFALNRLLPVQVQGNTIQPGTVSDDCRSFTGGSISGAQQAQSLPNTPAKWQGISFLCDLSNYNRNAVGTGSVGSALNTITLSGPTSGKHSFLLVYTDHNVNPDYNIFYEMLQSFRLK